MPGPLLSPAEAAVLPGLARGLTDSEIAAELGTSLWSVKMRLRRIAGKVGTGSRSAIVDHAYRTGILAASPRPRPLLSARQVDVLARIAEGLSEPEIGRALYLTRDTVKTHAARLYRRLGARNRTHAVALGHACGILPTPVRIREEAA